MKREKIDAQKLARPITKQEIKQQKKFTDLLLYLGIVEYFDSPNTHKDMIERYVPSNYNSLEEYERDKHTAYMTVCSGKKLKKELEVKLVNARKELESKGLWPI